MGKPSLGAKTRGNMVSFRANDAEKTEFDAEMRRRGFRDRAAFIRQLVEESKRRK